MKEQKDDGSMFLKSRTTEPVQVALLSGHCILVPPEGRQVPRMFLDEAFRCGCIPVQVQADVLGGQGPQEDADRSDLIKNAMKAMIERGEPMTQQGLPNLKTLATEVGFVVTKEECVNLFAELVAEAEGNNTNSEEQE